MKPCLHPSITTVDDLTSYLDIAKDAGFETVEVKDAWIDAAVSETGDLSVRKAFESRNLTLANFGLPVNFQDGEDDYQRDLALLPAFAESRLTLGATRCTAFLWPSIDELPVPYASRLARRLRECANVLSTYGVRLGLEFVGPHHLRNKKYPFVQDLKQLTSFLEGVGAANVGILMDSYHVYTAEVPATELLQLSGHQIVHVHINDANEVPAQAHDGRRLLPGDGQIDLTGFVEALYSVGYSGPISAEVLHQEPLAGTDLERARKVRETIQNYISKRH